VTPRERGSPDARMLGEASLCPPDLRRLRFARSIAPNPPLWGTGMLTLTYILFAAAGCLYVLLAAFLGHASAFVDFGHAGHVAHGAHGADTAHAGHADAGHGPGHGH